MKTASATCVVALLFISQDQLPAVHEYFDIQIQSLVPAKDLDEKLQQALGCEEFIWTLELCSSKNMSPRDATYLLSEGWTCQTIALRNCACLFLQDLKILRAKAEKTARNMLTKKMKMIEQEQVPELKRKASAGAGKKKSKAKDATDVIPGLPDDPEARAEALRKALDDASKMDEIVAATVQQCQLPTKLNLTVVDKSNIAGSVLYFSRSRSCNFSCFFRGHCYSHLETHNIDIIYILEI